MDRLALFTYQYQILPFLYLFVQKRYKVAHPKAWSFRLWCYFFSLTNFIYDSFFLLLQPKNRDLSFFFSSFFVSLQSVGRYHRHIPINQVPAESKNPKFRLFKRLLIPSLLDDIDVSQLQNWTCTGNSSLQCESREWVQHSIKNEIRHEKPSVGGRDVKQNAFDYAWTHQPI